MNITGPYLVKSDVMLSSGLFSRRVVTLREEPIGLVINNRSLLLRYGPARSLSDRIPSKYN